MAKEGRKRPRRKEDENHARVGRVWSAVELRRERKERRKERMSVVHGNKIQAHTRVRCAEIMQAAKPCAKRSLFYGEGKKKEEIRERAGDKESNRECTCKRRERARQRRTEKELSASR